MVKKDNSGTLQPDTPVDEVPEWKRSYTVPLGDEHPDCGAPGDIDGHDNMHKSLDVIRKAYDFCVGSDGRLYGLVSGDMGWAATHIILTADDIHDDLKVPGRFPTPR